MKKYLWIAIVAILVLWSGCSYNGLVRSEESVESQWANVETAYQRRADLIPNLVATVKGYADFEQETITAVIEARSKATQVQLNVDDLNPAAIQKFQQAQGAVGSALSRLLVTIERYPELKANQNFLELQAQLEGTENRISVERNRYNDTVKQFNSSVRTFPGVFIARLAGFEKKGYFEAAEGSDVAPTVEF